MSSNEAGWKAALKRLQAHGKLVKEAEAAMELAKHAEAPDKKLEHAQKAIELYKKVQDFFAYPCAETQAQLEIAKNISALAQRELDKPPLLRLLETLVQLALPG